MSSLPWSSTAQATANVASLNNNKDNNKNALAKECRVVMAPSTLPDSGWGLFTLVDQPRGSPVVPGDVVIHVTDLNRTHADGMTLWLHDYLWNSDETGGFYEGQESVLAVLPGIGMLANGLNGNQHNVLPFVPTVDEGGLTRLESPGAGAITHYHNYTFFVQRSVLEAGAEILVHYGDGWFRERKERLILQQEQQDRHLQQQKQQQQEEEVSISKDGKRIISTKQSQNQSQARTASASTTTTSFQDVVAPLHRPVEWLRQHGHCVDHLRAGRSRLPHAGRGAFATRDLPAGSIVSPVPVLTLPKRETLDIVRERQDGTIVSTKQLLLNYCYGHENSSLLLFPYAPLVNLINHGPVPNVKLQWSSASLIGDWSNRPLSEVKQLRRSGLLLELVATRDIQQGDEIYLDYGKTWFAAWRKHVQTWQPPPDAERYAPAYVHDDVVRSLRLEAELRDHPYPDNIFTSCFYRYSDNQLRAEAPTGKNPSSTAAAAVTTFRWNMTRGIFELRNLRPCQIIQRQHDPKQGTLFTVRILNRFGLEARERLPKGAVHIVTHVPRRAVRFSDKIYTTDQHLEQAFRHEIGWDDFPEQWKDLA